MSRKHGVTCTAWKKKKKMVRKRRRAEEGRPRAAGRRVPLLRAPSNHFPPNRDAATSFRPRSRGAQPALGVPGRSGAAARAGSRPGGAGSGGSCATRGEGAAGPGAGRAAGAGGCAEALAVAEVVPAVLRRWPGSAFRCQLPKSRSQQGTCPRLGI